MIAPFDTMIQISGLYIIAGDNLIGGLNGKEIVPFSAFFTFVASNPASLFNDGKMIDQVFESTNIKNVKFDQKSGLLVFTRYSYPTILTPSISEKFDLRLVGDFYQGYIYRNDQIFGIVQCQVTEIPREVITFPEAALIALDIYSPKA